MSARTSRRRPHQLVDSSHTPICRRRHPRRAQNAREWLENRAAASTGIGPPPKQDDQGVVGRQSARRASSLFRLDPPIDHNAEPSSACSGRRAAATVDRTRDMSRWCARCCDEGTLMTTRTCFSWTRMNNPTKTNSVSTRISPSRNWMTPIIPADAAEPKPAEEQPQQPGRPTVSVTSTGTNWNNHDPRRDDEPTGYRRKLPPRPIR